MPLDLTEELSKPLSPNTIAILETCKKCPAKEVFTGIEICERAGVGTSTTEDKAFWDQRIFRNHTQMWNRKRWWGSEAGIKLLRSKMGRS